MSLTDGYNGLTYDDLNIPTKADFIDIFYFKRSRDSAVGIATGYGLGD
jgi:hypothetical protein